MRAGMTILLFLGLSLPAAAQRSMKPVPIGNPADWFDSSSYPKDLARANRTGRVVVMLGVDSVGSVVTCAISTSSGTTALDERTCEIARERGRFNPATDEKGRPVASEYMMPVRWQLPFGPTKSDLASFPPFSAVTQEVSINAEGIVANCRVTEAIGLKPSINPCDNFPIGAQETIITRDGRAIPHRLIRRTSQNIIVDE